MRNSILIGIVLSTLGITTACNHPNSPISAAQAQTFETYESAQIAALEAELASANDRLREVRQERNGLREEIESFEARPAPVSSSSRLQAELNGLRSELNGMTFTLNEREKALTAEKSRHDSTRRRLDQALESMRHSATDPTEQRLRTEVRSLERALADAERRAGIRASERSELNHLRSRVTGLQQQLAAVRNADAELSRLRGQLQVTRAELVEAKGEEARALVRATSLRDKIGKLEASLSLEHRENAGLMAENNRLRSNQGSARQLTETRAELAALKRELNAVTSKLSNKSSRIVELQRDMGAVENALIAAERRADKLAEDVKRLRQENNNLRDRLDIRQANR